MKGLIAAAALLAGLCTAVQAAQAPDFSIAEVLNAPLRTIKSPADLKGKAVYLDFWATWCPPCVASLPHLNKLAEALNGQPVVIIAVTDEPAGVVESFLKTHPIKAWVGLDLAKAAVRAYKVNSRPDGYLIGRDGTLLARISPEFISEADLRAAAAGTYKAATVVREEEEVNLQNKGLPPLFELTLAAPSGRARLSSGEGEFVSQSVSFQQNVAYIWGVENSQVVMDTYPVLDNQPVNAFNAYLKTRPDVFEQGRELLKAAVQTAFHIKVEPVQEETAVYVLALSTAGGAAGPRVAGAADKIGFIAYGGGRLHGNERMPVIARVLWAALGKPVVDDTGLAGVYSFDMQWDPAKKEELDKLLAAQGLALVPARRKVDLLHVRTAR